MCFEKVPCMAIYILKIGVWNDSQTMWDSFQTSTSMQKTCLLLLLLLLILFFFKNVFETLRVRARSGLHAQADSCVHMPRASLALFFQKYIYLLIKSYIFHLKIFQVNLTSNWFLNQPWVIEF